MKTLEERIQTLEDRAALLDLTYRYGWAVSQGWAKHKIALTALQQLFTEDALWESEDMGIKIQGSKNILSSIVQETANLTFAMHQYSQPLLEIRDKEAQALWLFWIVSKADTLKQIFMSQEIRYKKTEERWRIGSVKVFFGGTMK
jgi:hypothetical protein